MPVRSLQNLPDRNIKPSVALRPFVLLIKKSLDSLNLLEITLRSAASVKTSRR